MDCAGIIAGIGDTRSWPCRMIDSCSEDCDTRRGVLAKDSTGYKFSLKSLSLSLSLLVGGWGGEAGGGWSGAEGRGLRRGGEWRAFICTLCALSFPLCAYLVDAVAFKSFSSTEFDALEVLIFCTH